MQRKTVFILLGIAFLVWLDWYIRAPDASSRQLTAAIQAQASAELKAYPYEFHVLKVEQGVVYLSTPRNVDVPAFKALAALHPGLDTKDPNNPDFIRAQQQLAAVQSEARALALSQPGVKDVRWELDRDWLAAQHIEVGGR